VPDEQQGPERVEESGNRATPTPQPAGEAPLPIVMNATPPERLLKAAERVTEGQRADSANDGSAAVQGDGGADQGSTPDS